MLFMLSACKDKQIKINELNDANISEGKVYILEDAVKQSYTWNEICDYFEKDVSFSSLPESILVMIVGGYIIF